MILARRQARQERRGEMKAHVGTVALALAVLTGLACGGLALQARAEGTNLALDRPVVVSSVQGNHTGARAVDGDLNTRWHSKKNSGLPAEWIRVEPLTSLYGPPIVQNVVLRWGSDHASAYVIQVSDDASTWIQVYGESSGDGGVDDITGLSATGKYVRVHAPESDDGYGLVELELYGSDAPAGDIGWRTVGGVVYAEQASPGNELEDALVECSQFSYVPRDGSCTPYQVTTGSDGAYEFHVFVHDTDTITISAEHEGYLPASDEIDGFDCSGSCPQIDLVLLSPTPTPTPPPPPPPTPTPPP
jgi:hypothetical protein